VITEEPKITLHIPAMRKIIAQAIAVDGSRVGVKATTNERLGAIGRSEGIAAMAIATVDRVSCHSSDVEESLMVIQRTMRDVSTPLDITR